MYVHLTQNTKTGTQEVAETLQREDNVQFVPYCNTAVQQT